MSENKVVKFEPFKSFVNGSFWYKLEEVKVDVIKLSDKPETIHGYYTNVRSISHILEVDYSSFNSEFSPTKNCYPVKGTLYIKNTIEDFKECKKDELINIEGNKLVEDIKNGIVLKDPRLLVRFLLLSFADVKSHKFYYWFCFPCPMTSVLEETKDPIRLSVSEELSAESVVKAFLGISEECNKPFFIIKKKMGNLYAKALSESDGDPDDYYCFCDPVRTDWARPSWVLRLYVYFLAQTL